MNVILDTALSYSHRGWRVFPVIPNSKLPAIKNWPQLATIDETTIRRWFAGGSCNIGIATGRESNLLIIDIDRHADRPDGLKEFNKICDEIDRPFKTPYAETAGYGFHLLYTFPQTAGRLPKQLAPGIDLIGEGRYFVAVPSTIDEMSYKWVAQHAPDEIDPADCTDWLISALAIIPPPSELKAIALPAPPVLPAETGLLSTSSTNMPAANPETPEGIEKLRSALGAIPPCLSYDQWRNVIFSVKAHGFLSGETIARAWSATCLEKYDAAAFDKVWCSDRGQGIGTGTLYHMAKQEGWNRPELTEAEKAEAVGDINNGRAFAKQFRGKLLYCHAAGKWLHWDGQRWAWCNAGQEVQCAKWVADRLLEDAAIAFKAAPSSGDTKALMQAAKLLHGNEKRLHAMLSMAATEEGMGIASPAMLDADPWMLGARNGVVDLRTGKLIAADPTMLMSKQCDAAFDEQAQCRRFRQFMEDVFQGDDEMIAYVQRSLGYALTGQVTEEVMFFWFGSGANGKSVLVNLIAGVTGSYAGHVSPDLLRAGRDAKGSAERATLRLAGLRLALMNELAEGETWDDGKLREITSRENIAARYLYAEAFDFVPTHKLFVRGNNKPAIRDGTDGTWRRLQLVGFDRQFAEDERIPDLDSQILDAERDGILKWLVDGCLQWQKHGLNAPAKVRNAVSQYRKDSDVLGEWMDCHCTTGQEFNVGKQSAYQNYKQWSEENGLRSMTSKSFSRRLGERGFQLDSGRRNYQGFKLQASMLMTGIMDRQT